ncbi:MAG: TetR/AcrR family transcriptional regulator [Acidimicrobiales bacterium]
MTVRPDATSKRPGDVRRRELIKITLAVMSERGFADTRITDIAERAGISPALVIYYFSTKDELLTEALRSAEDSWYEIGAARSATMDSAAARLEQIVALSCLPQPNEDLPESWSPWLDLWTQSVRNPAIAAVRREFDQRWRLTIADIVLEGQTAGEFEAVDAMEFAITLTTLLDGLDVQIALDDPVVTPDRAFEIAMQFASLSLGFTWE